MWRFAQKSAAFLNLVVVLSSYMGICSVVYNSSTNQFEKCYKWYTSKMIFSLTMNIMFVFVIRKFYTTLMYNIFVTNVAEELHVYLMVILAFSFTFFSKRNETTFLATLNKLNKFQSEVPDCKKGKLNTEKYMFILFSAEAVVSAIATFVYRYFGADHVARS